MGFLIYFTHWTWKIYTYYVMILYNNYFLTYLKSHMSNDPTSCLRLIPCPPVCVCWRASSCLPLDWSSGCTSSNVARTRRAPIVDGRSCDSGKGFGHLSRTRTHGTWTWREKMFSFTLVAAETWLHNDTTSVQSQSVHWLWASLIA